MHVATYSFTDRRRFQVSEVMPNGDVSSVVDEERMDNTHANMDVLGIDLDFDNWPDFLHPMSYPYEWSQNVAGSNGRRTFVNKATRYGTDAPMKAYSWPFSAVDMTNRNVLSTFAYEYAYHRYPSTNPPQNGIKMWPPIRAHDGCCNECKDVPGAQCTLTTDVQPACGNPCTGDCPCTEKGNAHGIPVRGFPQCQYGQKHFFLWHDCSGDGLLDVILACNNQPPQLYINDNGDFLRRRGDVIQGKPNVRLEGGDVADLDGDGYCCWCCCFYFY